jgi:YVTN family beta-propeller protein
MTRRQIVTGLLIAAIGINVVIFAIGISSDERTPPAHPPAHPERGREAAESKDPAADAAPAPAPPSGDWLAHAGGHFRVWGGTQAGSQPKSVQVAASGAVYVANTGFHDRDNVDRWDPVTLETVATAQFKGNAIEQVLSPDQKTLYVSNFYHEEILALDAQTLRVRRRYRAGKVPKHLTVSDDGARMFVSNWDDDTMTIIDLAGGKTATVAVGNEPRGTVLSRDQATVYVVNFSSDDVSVIDAATRTVKKTIAAADLGCDAPRHAAVTRDDAHVLVTCYHEREVVVIDRRTDTVERRVEVGKGPKTIDVSFDGRFAYTADYKGHSMTVIDLATWQAKTIPLPVWRASGLAVAPDDRRIYVTGWDSRNLVVVERWLPGDTPGPLSAKQTQGRCLRVPRTGCDMIDGQ